MECVGEPVIITGGEASKNNPHLLAQLHRKVADEGIDRHSFIIAIGGGAVLDLVGFASCHRTPGCATNPSAHNSPRPE